MALGSVFVYGLRDPRDGSIRYVGRTRYPKQRLNSHCGASEYFIKRRSAKSKWVRRLRRRGLKPEMVILERCVKDRRVEVEAKWIQHYRTTGKLYNVYDSSTCNRFTEARGWNGWR